MGCGHVRFLHEHFSQQNLMKMISPSAPCLMKRSSVSEWSDKCFALRDAVLVSSAVEFVRSSCMRFLHPCHFIATRSHISLRAALSGAVRCRETIASCSSMAWSMASKRATVDASTVSPFHCHPVASVGAVFCTALSAAATLAALLYAAALLYEGCLRTCEPTAGLKPPSVVLIACSARGGFAGPRWTAARCDSTGRGPVILVNVIPIVRHRKRASPPTVIASERNMMPEKMRLVRKASRNRSPTPTRSAIERRRSRRWIASKCWPAAPPPVVPPADEATGGRGDALVGRQVRALVSGTKKRRDDPSYRLRENLKKRMQRAAACRTAAFSFVPAPDWGRQLWSDHSDALDLFIKQGADGEIIFIKFCCEKYSCKNLTLPLDPHRRGNHSAKPPASGVTTSKRVSTWGASHSRSACHPPPPLHVASVRRVLMTLIESIDTMKMTENTMDDASECVPTRTCGSYVPNPIRPHDAKHLSHSYQNKTPSNTPMAMEGPPF